MRSGTDVGKLGLARNWHPIHPKGVRWGWGQRSVQASQVLCRPVKLYSCHYALGKVAFSWYPPNPDLSVGLPGDEAWFITPEKAFPLLQSSMALSFTLLQLTLGIADGKLRLVCGCSAMETHLVKLSTNSSCADIASRGSLEFGSECCNWGQTIFKAYALQHSVFPWCSC